MIVMGRAPKQIPITPFKLDSATENSLQDSVLRSNATLLRTFTASSWIPDKSTKNGCRKSVRERENALSAADRQLTGHTEVEFGNLKFSSEHSSEFLKFLQRGTRPNELFLTKTVENDVTYFKCVYDWFDETLRLMFPTPRSSEVETASIAEREFVNGSRDIFRLFDLGIDSVILEDFAAPMPESVKQDFLAAHREDSEDIAIQFPSDNLYVFVSSDNRINARQFKTIHRVVHENRDVKFELDQESDGTQRLFELSAALLGLLSGSSDKVYVIDELDRRLHPHMT